MGSRFTGTRWLLGLVALEALSLQTESANAALFTAACSGKTGSPSSLVAAINSANGAAGGTVKLGSGCTYALTAVDNYWYGPNGLPAIASAVTIEGNGATIARSSAAGTPPFRLFFVGANPLGENYVSPGDGSLTLRDVTLTGGLAQGGSSHGGGGGAGMGGAILNQGSVVIDHSTLTRNAAHGGSATSLTAGEGGGGIGSDARGDVPTAGGFGGPAPGDQGAGAGGLGDPMVAVAEEPGFDTERAESAPRQAARGPAAGPPPGWVGLEALAAPREATVAVVEVPTATALAADSGRGASRTATWPAAPVAVAAWAEGVAPLPRMAPAVRQAAADSVAAADLGIPAEGPAASAVVGAVPTVAVAGLRASAEVALQGPTVGVARGWAVRSSTCRGI